MATKSRYNRKGGTDNDNEQKLDKTSTREQIFEHIAVHTDELNKGTSVSVVFDDKTEEGKTLTHIALCRKRRGADGGGVHIFQLPVLALSNSVKNDALAYQKTTYPGELRDYEAYLAALAKFDADTAAYNVAKAQWDALAIQQGHDEPEPPEHVDEVDKPSKICKEALQGLRPCKVNGETVWRIAPTAARIGAPAIQSARIDHWEVWSEKSISGAGKLNQENNFNYVGTRQNAYRFIANHIEEVTAEKLKRKFKAHCRKLPYKVHERDGLELLRYFIDEFIRVGAGDVRKTIELWECLEQSVTLDMSPEDIYTEFEKVYKQLESQDEKPSHHQMVLKFIKMCRQSGYFPIYKADFVQRIVTPNAKEITLEVMEKFAETWSGLEKDEQIKPQRHEAMVMHERILAAFSCFICDGNEKPDGHRVESCPLNPLNPRHDKKKIAQAMGATLATVTEKKGNQDPSKKGGKKKAKKKQAERAKKSKERFEERKSKSGCVQLKCLSPKSHDNCDKPCGLCLKDGKSESESKKCNGKSSGHELGATAFNLKAAAKLGKCTAKMMNSLFPKWAPAWCTKESIAGVTDGDACESAGELERGIMEYLGEGTGHSEFIAFASQQDDNPEGL